MSIKIYSSKEQANSNFNNGEILEKKYSFIKLRKFDFYW